MNTRIDVHELISVGNGYTSMEDVTVYAATRKDAMKLSTDSFVCGSVLFIINEGRTFMLNADGRDGEWRDVTDGSVLTEGGEV